MLHALHVRSVERSLRIKPPAEMQVGKILLPQQERARCDANGVVPDFT